MITVEQLRAARAMLRMEQTQLAERSGVSVETIKRLEAGKGRLKAQHLTLSNIQTALEFAGIDFLDDKDSPGVRLAADKSKALIEALTVEITGLVRASLEVQLMDDPKFSQRSKEYLIKTVLSTLSRLLRRTLPNRLPGK